MTDTKHKHFGWQRPRTLREAWKAFDAFVRWFEELPWTPAAVAATLAAIITLRNLLEIAAGTNPIFDGLQAFVHYPLAYVGPFLALTLVLALWGRVPPGRVARLMSLAWLLTLLPPVIDVILHRHHEGVTIGYLQTEPGDLAWVFVHFFDPRVSLTGTTAGIRVEAFLAVLLGALYIYLRSRNWWRALAGAATVYVTSLFFFTLPTIVHGLLRLRWPGLDREQFFHARGVLAWPDAESVPDRLAIFWLVPVVSLAGLVWWLAERRCVAGDRWLVGERPPAGGALARVLFLVPVAVSGVLAALALTLDPGRRVSAAPYDLMALLALVLVFALGPVAIARRDALGVGVVLMVASLAAGLGGWVCVPAAAALAAFLPHAAGVVPGRVKWLYGAIVWALAGYAAFVAGYTLVTGSEALARLPAGVAVPAVLAGLAAGVVVFSRAGESRWWAAPTASVVLGLGVLFVVNVLMTTGLRETWGEQARNVPRLIRLEAVELMQEGKLAEARPIFERALEVDPDDVESLRGLGLILLQEERKPFEAARLFERAVETAPRSAADWINLGIARIAAGQLAEALEALERAHRLAPRDRRVPAAVFQVARRFDESGERESAVRAYERFVAMADGMPEHSGQLEQARRRLHSLR